MNRKIWHLFPMPALYIILAAVLTPGWACKKVIQVDLNSAAPRIVIEGNITDGPGPYQVSLSTTVNYSASNNYPPVSGATVQITDSNAAQTFTLNETSAGIYSSSSLQGQSRHTYLLSVSYGGASYTASSTMPAAVQLDSVTFVKNLDFNNKEAINAVVNFPDPPGLGNEYQFIEFDNGKRLPDIFVFEDRLSDGKYIRQTLYNDTSTLVKGDRFEIDMYCVDKNIYNYFFSLFTVTGNNGFNSASPANPISNISNGALGYFSAHTVVSRSLYVY